MPLCRRRLLVAGALLFVLACLVAPAAPARVPNPGQPRGRVYLIRGQGWVFSGGWAVLRDRLRAAGVSAEDVSDLDGNWVADHLLTDHRAGRLREPVVLVGHSRGGRQALSVAGKLRREGIRIDLILTADVMRPPEVPANVGRAVNLYLTKRRLYPACPLKPAPGSPAAIENVALDAPGSPFHPHGLHHLNFTDSDEVQEYLFRRVMEVVAADSRGSLGRQ